MVGSSIASQTNKGGAMRLFGGGLVWLLVMCGAASAQVPAPVAETPAGLQLHQFEGPPVQGGFGGDAWLNAGSTLSRQWYTVSDPSSPVQLERRAGLTVVRDRLGASSMRFTIGISVEPREPVAALELQCHVFDPFGRLVRTLSTLRVMDLAVPTTVSAEWSVLSTREASELFASVCYVHRTRTAAGRVYSVDRAGLLTLLRRVGSGVAESDLEGRGVPPAK